MAELTRGAKWAAAGLLVLVVLTGGGNLLATHDQINSQNAQNRAQRQQAAKQGAIVEQKLCSTLATFEPLSSLVAPPGNPAANPSRAYEQRLTRLLKPLAQLGPDLGCRKGKS
jgi:hypothetical protein